MFHYNKHKRREEIIKLKKQKKLEWIKKLYIDGKSLYNIDYSDHRLNEDDELLNWTASLDFDVYYADWLTTAVTGKSDDHTNFTLPLPEYADVQSIEKENLNQESTQEQPQDKKHLQIQNNETIGDINRMGLFKKIKEEMEF
ncbi:hypothetical protein HK098_002802 [Nowakowskiella sp. JEL0407]|nr:hypothetical protein HK098_002802 [Nowakowskiella sp. JEL0407]